MCFVYDDLDGVTVIKRYCNKGDYTYGFNII